MIDVSDARRGLLKFVPPIFLRVPVLLIDSTQYLADLRKILPAARIAVLSSEPTPAIKKICDECRADLIDELPNEQKIFELIIARDVLTTGEDFYATLLKLNLLLKDSGALLTEFFNVRSIGVLERLRRGKFCNNEQRFWAKADVVKLLVDATYKEIRFLPGERENFPADDWINFGFDNFSDDLTTKIWLVKACKCTAEVAALKEIFTPEVRAELSRLLHRIEYDIDVEENFRRLDDLCAREGIFDDYLRDFTDQVVVHASAKEKIFSRERPQN